ncbi:CBS domain-containing protein [Alteromonas sp. BMJM2]|uniref:CBS domain-containing protein n=1 Tax=Alteromonas sp. BMJM2 TaxID=2954241 RepID=UPI0022B4A70C|nr:CBS domain-containing protein [Alteromonas sp. BMJM2]
MHTLQLHKTDAADRLAWPVIESKVTLTSSAMSVFTDFKQYMPLVIDENALATRVENIMRQSHVRMMLVVNASNAFSGIITSQDVHEQHIVRQVAELQIPRDSLVVRDFMQDKTSLMSFDYTELAKSSVGDVIETLKDYGQHHCLVLDRGTHEVRGVISVSDIARKLKAPLDVQDKPTFSQLIRALAA